MERSFEPSSNKKTGCSPALVSSGQCGKINTNNTNARNMKQKK